MAYYSLGDNFNWFMGRVVELDPVEEEKYKRYLGRVKIRVLHDQTGDLGKVKKSYGITDDDLLWAWPLSSIQSASLSYRKIVELEEYPTPFWIDAVGTSPTGIAVGTYVFGFYLDGQEGNIPVIFSTYHKDSLYPEPPTDDATGEMLQVKPPEGPMFDYMDVSALAKGWHEDQERDLNHPKGQEYPLATEPEQGGQMLPKHKSAANPDGYKKGLMNLVWEPASDYNTKYPFNTVHTTKSGHAFEIDDTEGHERVHWWHRSGSYEEISNNIQGATPWRDGLPGEYPETMLGWQEPMKDHTVGIHPPYEGRRVRKTYSNEYNIALENREHYVGASEKTEIANNTTIGIDNNHIETVASTVYIAVGFYPRTANNELSGESARYQIEDSWDKETKFRENADKKVKRLPETRKYDFITDVANNVQMSVGWTWKKAREMPVHSEKNHFVEIANNQLTSLGWIPLDNEDGDKEGRVIQESKDIYNYYLDIKSSYFNTIGWKPFDEARQYTDLDSTNFYTDVKMSAWFNVGYEPKGEDARLINAEDNWTYNLDVKGTTRQTTGDCLYLAVGKKPKDERKRTKEDEGSYFIDVNKKMATFVGNDYALKTQGNYGLDVVGNTLMHFNRLAVLDAENELVMNSKMGITLNAPSTTVLGPLYTSDGLGTEKAVSGSFTCLNGTTVTVTNGIVTDITNN